MYTFPENEPIRYIGDDGERHTLEMCEKGEVWKISSPSLNPDNANLTAVLIDASQRLTFADLSGSSVGQTTGTGPTAQITLDDNAAGHNWYIDPTPTDNTEFLPTSNPNEWIAKEGSDAYGKMDLLSVLLHEVGHALGLAHSSDAHDFMAATLQPGMRRTLTADEQSQLMQLAGYFPTPDSPGVPYRPTDPGAPLPFTRVTDNTRLARRRTTGVADDLAALPLPQFDTVANPQLTNPAFTAGQGWTTSGAVTFSSGAATLSETPASQTRLKRPLLARQQRLE